MVQVERKRREAGGRKKERGRKIKKGEKEGGDYKGTTSNKHVCSRDVEGQQREESVVSNKRISQSISNCEVRKVS